MQWVTGNSCQLFHTHPAEAASVPFLHPSCLAAAASRSRSWYVWPLSPPRSGNKPLWNQKSSPHEKPVWQGGAGLEQSARWMKPSVKVSTRWSCRCGNTFGFTVDFQGLAVLRSEPLSKWEDLTAKSASCVNPQATGTAGCSVKCAM